MRIKKILSLLVATLMIFSMFTTVTFAADEATLTVSSATAKAGDTVEITVTAANNPGMVSAYITLNYDDEALELVNVTDSGVWPGQLHSPTYNVNPYTLSWDNGSAPANITANGVLATLTFKVKEDAVAGDYNVSLAYDIDNLEIMDFDFNGVEFDLVAGKVTVEAEGGNEPPATDAATLTVGSATAAAGDIIEVPVTAANNPGMVSAYITLNFDDALELVGVTDSGVWPGQLHSPTYNVNPYTLSWDNGSAPANITENGVLATLKFKVKETAAAGDYNIWLTYDPENLEIMDFDFNPVYFDLVAGKVTVEGAAAPATYDVVFVADGETVATITKTEGETLAVADFPAVPAKAGYTGAWNVTEDITAATTVEAVYTRNTFTVTFVAEGVTVATKTVNEGEKLAVANFPEVPAKEGYTGAWDVTTDITAATTVTAVYTAIPTPEPPATDKATLTISSAAAKAGDTVEVTVTAANNPGMVSAYITLNFDDALELVGVTDSGVWPGQLHSPTYNVNPYTLSWDNGSAPANITENGVLATLKFKVKETAAAGDYNIWLTYDPENLEIMDFDFNPVYFDLVAGKVTVEGAAAPATYDVVFVADGETVATKTVNVGDKLAVADFPEVPAKAGYTGAWNVTEDITAATTVEAVYTRNTFTVTFVADGETVATKTVNEGEALAVANFPAVPAKAGYTGAWNVTEDITAATTVEAVYTRNTFTVTFVAEGVTVATKTVNEGEKLAVANFPEVPAKEGYTGAWDVTTDITAATTVTAVYTAIPTPEPPATDKATLTISSAAAKAGDTVEVTVTAANNPGMVSAYITLNFDDALELVGVTDSGVWPGQLHSPTYNVNPYTLSWDNGSAPANITENGVLATLKFKVKETAASGDYNIWLTYDPENLEIMDFDFNPVYFDLVAGKVTVEGAAAPATYDVVFVADGETVATKTVNVGDKLAVADFPAVPAKAGYTGAWNVTEDITAATTVEAVYTRNTFTVTFVADGETVATKTVNEGEALAVANFPAVPAKAGYAGAWDVTTDITGAATVTAVYTAKVYGDVDGDGEVATLVDLMTLERHLAHWIGYDEIVEINADLDEDGFVTVIDVMILAKHIADWSGFEELPCK